MRSSQGISAIAHRGTALGSIPHLAISAVRAALVAALLSGAWTAGAPAQQPPQPSIEQPPPEVRQLVDLLKRPAVRDWLDKLDASGSAEEQTGPASSVTSTEFLSGRLIAIREHFKGLAAALPQLPDDFARAWGMVKGDLAGRGFLSILLLLAVFVGLGFGLEWLFRRAMAGLKAWIEDLQLHTVGDRLRAVLVRFAYSLAVLLVFAVGSIGAFLAFDWPPLLHRILLGYLLAFLILRVAWVVGRFLLAPGVGRAANEERFRIVPMATDSAQFWYRRIGLFAGWFGFGWITVILLDSVGFSLEARRLVAYVLGIGLVAIAAEAVWRRPDKSAAGSAASVKRRLVRRVPHILACVYFVVLWMLWVASANRLFWLGAVVVLLPAAISLTRRSVNHLLRPPGSVGPDTEAPSVAAVCLERGLRAGLIVGAVLLLAQKWGIDLATLASGDTPWARIIGGALSAVIIALIAEFLWHLAKAVIDRKIAEVQEPGQPDTDVTRKRARLRTLLPVLRNILFVVLVVMAVLLGLSSMGVQIAPLIAGAGVVGVAIGFGAQTLVKDVISGMFYLLDDAFRVGEYIQSGSYKGTVESFSLRSVKLRHHRGPLYTVPFGVLGAVENMSRDWVIDKLTVGVTYDTDLDKAKKLIKQIGKELAADAEFAPHIIDTLKMQGVEQFGDYAIQLRMKMMTKPGEQFVIRRRAFALIKKAFDANGIKFAFPTVQVAGGDDDTAAAAARQALAVTAAKQPAA